MKIVIVNTHISRRLGGSQVQCDLIASELTARGHETHYIAIDGHDLEFQAPYQLHAVSFSGRAVADKCAEIRPDIVYWRYNKRLFYKAARLIANRGIPIVFSVSHIADTEKWATKVSLGRATWRDVLRSAKSMVSSRWNYQGFRFVNGVVVNNAAHLNRLPVARQIHIDNSIVYREQEGPRGEVWPRPYCLWVANIKPQKQPDKFLELAGMLTSSNMDFLMVGPIQSARYRYFTEKDACPPNYYYLGRRGINAVNTLIQNSLFVVHTCLPEGFPNIFIQAWRSGKPVASLCFDPDGVIAAERVGFCSGTLENLVADVDRLRRDRALREELGTRGMALVQRRFNLRSNVGRLEQFLLEVLLDKGGRPGAGSG